MPKLARAEIERRYRASLERGDIAATERTLKLMYESGEDFKDFIAATTEHFERLEVLEDIEDEQTTRAMHVIDEPDYLRPLSAEDLD